jgi:cellulose synthase/poly-beta-1,6-N-acetylglucosamine synthase-like glycosyltransferase
MLYRVRRAGSSNGRTAAFGAVYLGSNPSPAAKEFAKVGLGKIGIMYGMVEATSQKISLLVVAHNEERRIGACLDSVLSQTRQPDEIIVIAHNCTDRTAELARAYNHVVVDEYEGSAGTVHARIRGFALAKYEITVCLDGDSRAEHSWLDELTKPFDKDDVVGVGGFVILDGLVGRLLSYDFFFWRKWYWPRYRFYFWGASFAVRRSAYLQVSGFEGLLALKDKLDLHYWAEDLYLSLKLNRVGRVVFASKARVGSPTTPQSLEAHSQRSTAQRNDKHKLFEFFGYKA